MNTKPWYTSRILWVNSIAAMLVALELGWKLFQPFVPVNFYLLIAAVLPVVNAGLRVYTNAALTAGAAPDAKVG